METVAINFKAEIKNFINQLLELNNNTPEVRKKFNNFESKMVAQDSIIKKMEDLAIDNNTLLGRIFKIQMADSYAMYVVGKVNQKTVRLDWINYCDGWVDSRIGDSGIVDIHFVESQIKFEDSFRNRKTRGQIEKEMKEANAHDDPNFAAWKREFEKGDPEGFSILDDIELYNIFIS